MKSKKHVILKKGDEVELAHNLLAHLKKEGEVLFSDGEVWRYDDQTGLWATLSEAYCIGVMMSHFREAVTKSGKKYYDIHLSYQKCKGAFTLLRSIGTIQQEGFFKHAPPGVVVKNGFLTFVDGKVVLADHDESNRQRSGYSDLEYDEKAGCPEWQKTLNDIFAGDEDRKEKLEVLQQFLGACVIGKAASYQTCLMLIGHGANGKSLLMEAFRIIFPRDAVTAVPPNKWDHEYYTARLSGSRLNTVGELPKASVLESESFKAVIAGDMVTARMPYAKPYDFCPIGGHVFAANSLPKTWDHSDGFWRRFIVLSFNQQFKPGDPGYRVKNELMDAIETERAGILVWALTGAALLQRQGCYTIPPSSRAAARAWRASINSVSAWKEEKCTILDVAGRKTGKKRRTKASDLYDNYKEFCGLSQQKVYSQTRFGRVLGEMGIAKIRRNSGWFWEISLKSKRVGCA